MTDEQWRDLLRVLDGELLEPLPVGFLIDSPWLAPWHGVSIVDYVSDDATWLEANLRAVRRFPHVLLLPGCWAEFGMCTEPSAFGSKCVWPEGDFPFAEKVLFDYGDVKRLRKPNPRTDGLLPFVVKLLQRNQARIEAEGHRIRFATSRGPLNVACYLLGHTEVMIGVRTNPDEIHRMLQIVTEFIIDWVRLQAAAFPSIDGVLLLDDLIGFLGDDDFRQFALPYFKQIFDSFDVSVKALHNDCHGLINARYLAEMGCNLFNFSFEHGLEEVRRLAGDSVTLLGNIPPRDVMARGTAEDVTRSVGAALESVADRRRIILSLGGGTPPGVPTENFDAFYEAAAGRA